MMTRLASLCAALRASHATVLIESRTALRVRGPGLQALADEIRYWKPELIRGLFGMRGAEPFACARCGAEVVTAADFRCAWCLVAPTSELQIIPGSSAERAYLRRVLHSAQTSQTSQTSQPGDVGQISANDPRRQHAAA